MSLPRRERRTLKGIETGICSSDPGLALWMALFSRLTADEDMPEHERGPQAIARMRAITCELAAGIVCGLGRVAGACLRALTATNPRTGPYGSLDGRQASPVVGAPWHLYRYR
jgi:hypothetical protein